MTVSSRQRCRPSGCDDEQSHLPITYNSIGVVPNGKVSARWVASRITFWIAAILVLTQSLRSNRVEETLQRLQQEQPQPLFTPNTKVQSRPTRNVIVVGLVGSLQEIFQHSSKSNNNMVDALSHVCFTSSGEGRKVEVHVLYRNDHNVADNTKNPNFFQTELRRIWGLAGCRVTLVPESEAFLLQYNITTPPDFASLDRFTKLAKLRSLQRSLILSRQGENKIKYDVVFNIDFDVMALPEPSIVQQAIDHVARTASPMRTNPDSNFDTQGGSIGHGSILCANGFEAWKLPYVSYVNWLKPHLFYDTLAAIDDRGVWYYPIYSCNVFNIITFAQSTLFRKILFFKPKDDQDSASHATTSFTMKGDKSMEPRIWPMQSCFGGLTIYDWDTWAFPECDYDSSQITLVASPTDQSLAVENDQKGVLTTNPGNQNNDKWKISQLYTLDRQEGGSTCEHLVFQQCLRSASANSASFGAIHEQVDDTATNVGVGNTEQPPQSPPLGHRGLEIGIMSDLVVEREANLLPTRAAQIKTLILVLMGLGAIWSLFILCASVPNRSCPDKECFSS